MKFHKHIDEPFIIDYLLGKLDVDRQSQLILHIKECEQCANRLQQWQSIINVESNVQKVPSDQLKEKIWMQLQEKSAPRRESKNRKIIFTISSVAAILLLFLGLYANKQPQHKSYEIAHNDEIENIDFQHYPDTKQWNIVPVSNSNPVHGNIWINHHTQELLVEVEGLVQLSNKDYQLWIIYNDNQMIGEVLPIEEGSTRLFFKGEEDVPLKIIKASIEPKGGSVSPTGPETFIVEMGNK
ncbi:anti-sigma factor [Caldibacillus lycopersici]|uniref:Anti-sigma factor n=1 Tax=Perspicuibacillus lycopersici TaxID=1325689 RepID=A0AAE3LME9_9BACI|nr:anti-sigma factor [Perspicuibacillus lycopersici]MCU9612866.1 anti-sigma factor [Perspicuibacillus lycopersici]